MINPMAAIKTDSNQEKLPRDDDLMSGDELRARLEHIDTQLHQVMQFIEEHRPALARGMALLDPAAKLREAFGGRPKGGKRG